MEGADFLYAKIGQWIVSGIQKLQFADTLNFKFGSLKIFAREQSFILGEGQGRGGGAYSPTLFTEVYKGNLYGKIKAPCNAMHLTFFIATLFVPRTSASKLS